MFYDSPGHKLWQRGPVPGLGKSTGSLRTKELVREWLHECEQHHGASCGRKYQTTTPLPHCILQIETYSSDTIKLCEDIKDNAQYICLSYCWGKEQERVLTTKDTIEKHKAGIPIKELPSVFQQSIELARYLQIGYIWIDALCIVQYDEEDWRNEAGKMAQIYSNSWLTIAATTASGPQHGLFRERALKELHSTEGSFSVQATRHFPNQPTNDTNGVFPLLKRGWAYQERLLSPRVVHFGPDEITWECFENRRCECGQNMHKRDEIDKRKVFKYSDGLGSEYDSRKVGNFWRSIGVQYTGLSLTKPNDRLYALHGILSIIGSARQRASKDVYLAGLWQETLAFDLLWYLKDGRKKLGDRNQEQLKRAPTWSWASVDDRVECPQELYYRPDTEIKRICQAIVDNNNSSSTLSSEPIGPAQIRLDGPGFKFTVGIRDGIDHSFIYYDNDSVQVNEELHFCLVARNYRACYALVLRAHGQ
jgi:hypothetical protein